MGMDSKKLFAKSSSTRLASPKKEFYCNFCTFSDFIFCQIQSILPIKLDGSSFVILFLVRISLTSLVMLVKAPGCMLLIRLLDTFTDNSLGWVRSTRGVRESEINHYYYYAHVPTLLVPLLHSEVVNAKVIKNTLGFCFVFLSSLSYLRWATERARASSKYKTKLKIIRSFFRLFVTRSSCEIYLISFVKPNVSSAISIKQFLILGVEEDGGILTPMQMGLK